MNWFIIQGKDHLGPFTEEFLRKMFAQGQIGNDSLVWQEGMEQPDSYYNLFVTKGAPSFKPLAQSAPPPSSAATKAGLPKLPTLEEIEDVKPTPAPAPKPVVQELPPALPPQSKPRATVTLEEIHEDDSLEETESTGSKLKWVILGTLLLGVAGLSVVAVTYYRLHSPWTRPQQMSFSDYERLYNTAESSRPKQFSFSLAQDKGRIWMATNNFNYGPVYLKLVSVPGRVLTDQAIIVEAQGLLENRLASFERFNFSEGTKLVDGHYQVEVYTKEPLKVPLLLTLNQDPLQFKYEGEVLVTSMPTRQFEKALQDYIKEKASNDNSFWSELSQKYATLRAITVQIRDSMEGIFSTPDRWKEKVQSFENDYKLNFGQFFTNFVISNNESYAALTEQTFSDKVEIIASYNRLSTLAKSVGSSSMVILEELEAFQGQSDPKAVDEIKRTSLQKLDAIISECGQKITEAQGK